jgi:hypothetical protein
MGDSRRCLECSDSTDLSLKFYLGRAAGLGLVGLMLDLIVATKWHSRSFQFLLQRIVAKNLKNVLQSKK